MKKLLKKKIEFLKVFKKMKKSRAAGEELCEKLYGIVEFNVPLDTL